MNRVAIGNVSLDPVSLSEAVTNILQLVSHPQARCQQVVTVNAQFVIIAEREARLAAIIRGSALSVADGVPLLWVASASGNRLRGRVNGTELMVQLCEEAAIYGKSVYFLGGRPEAAAITAERLQRRHPGLLIAGIDCPPFGFDGDPALDKEVADRINEAAPDIVFVALGAPKAEYWIEEHLHLNAKVMIGVGGSFELVGGITKRAPIYWQKAGCEWLWRLCMEPRRLWKRYLIGNLQFLAVVLRQARNKQHPRVAQRADLTAKLRPAGSVMRGDHRSRSSSDSAVFKA
jgi:N-acetylglucosaminyldiphosphoundecaprenol N-acetyl-beta-D-mannosaminyltransferase